MGKGKYKIITADTPELFETILNEVVKDGWSLSKFEIQQGYATISHQLIAIMWRGDEE